MTRLPRRAWLRAAAVTLLLLPAALTPEARAGEVAGSARASSLLLPPELLDAPLLLHRYPQLAATVPERVRATTGSGTAIGANAHPGNGTSLFALSQSFGGIVVPLSSQLVQAGGAARWGRLRLGAAVRGSRGRGDAESRDIMDDSTVAYSRSESSEHYVEAALGIGLGNDDSFLDLVLETYRETFDLNTDYMRSGDTLTMVLRPDEVFRGAVALRAGFRGPRGSRVRLTAEFQDRSSEADLTLTGADYPTKQVRLEDYGHRWHAGLSVSGSLDTGTRGTAFATYRDLREPDYVAYRYNSRSIRRTARNEDATFGFALERPLPQDFLLLAGFRNRFHLAKTQRREEEIDEIWIDDTVDESLGQEFSWGLSRAMGDLDLTGAMRADLALSYLFVSMDVVFRL